MMRWAKAPGSDRWRRRFADAAAATALCLAAFAVAGATTAPDPRPDPDACRLLTDLDLEPLLFGGEGGTLDSSSTHPAPGLSVCRWEARPKDRSASEPPRTTTLSFYHLIDRPHAVAQLAAQPRDADGNRPSLATDGQGDDEIVRSAPDIIVARHGADVAVLDARGAELANPGKLEARYLLDADALKAAGASVKSPPWAKPGQKAGWAPLPDPATLAANAGWTPPANAGVLSTAWLAWPLHLVVLLMRHGFSMMFLGIFGSIGLGGLIRQKASKSAPSTGMSVVKSLGYLLVPVFIIGAVVNLVMGDALADRLIYQFGMAATAKITGSHGTSTQYNNHDVVGYDVLIRSPSGGTTATGFEDDDFNVYPPHNATRYPGQGDVFTVRYLPGFVSDFAIVSNDESPWALGLRCAGLRNTLSQAQSRASFSRSAGDQAAAEQADVEMARARCASTD